LLVGAAVVWFGVENAGSDHLHARRSVRSLLESKDFALVAASNILAGGVSSDADLVNKYVVEGLANLTTDAKLNDPDFYKSIDSTFVSDTQWDSVLGTVRRMSDPRVQKMGYEVAKVVHERQAEGSEGVKRGLVERFQNRTAELREMRDVYFPVVRRSIVSNRLLDFSSTGRRLAGTVDWKTLAATSGLSDDQLVVYGSMFQKALAIIAGLIEQVRVALTQAKFLGDAFGRETKIPQWAASMVGGLAFVTQLSDCVSQADDNKVKLYMCPMRYASSLADLLTGFEELFDGVRQSPTAADQQSPTAADMTSGLGGFTWSR